MGNPNDSGEDRFIEKLGRMEEEAYREERSGIVIIAAVIFAILLGLGVVVAFAAEPEGTTTEVHRGSGVPLHRPDGTTLYVNPNAIAYVRDALPSEVGNATVVFANGAKQAVQETVHEIIEAIEKDRPRGGK